MSTRWPATPTVSVWAWHLDLKLPRSDHRCHGEHGDEDLQCGGGPGCALDLRQRLLRQHRRAFDARSILARIKRAGLALFSTGVVPVVGQQLLDAVVELRGQSCQHLLEVGPRAIGRLPRDLKM